MRYYEVFPAATGYQKPDPLTYHSDDELANFTVVAVPFGPKIVPGFIAREVSKPNFKTKQLTRILPVPKLPKELAELHAWLIAYYAAPAGNTTLMFTPNGLLTSPKGAPKATEPATKIEPLPPLTSGQEAAVNAIANAPGGHVLLHGETGSGKTRIYIERTIRAINDGKSVIVLTPEISLTPQLVRNFSQAFGNKVVLMHSGLTTAQRRDLWLKIANSIEPLVVIGARSALFTPLKNIGLIVVDEMHEPAYKQDQAPKYHAIRAAAKLGQLFGSEVIYGSATPLISEYYLAERTKMPIVTLKEAAKAAKPVRLDIVSLKDKSLFGRNPYLSDGLLEAIETRLEKKEQSLLFLNRRGTARTVICQTCGWQARCPNCDLPLTFHADFHELRCHTCGYRSAPPLFCPECRGTELHYRTIGTKALVDTLQGFFPEARIKRFDTDTGAADTLDKHYDTVQKGEVDILVGTQMLGKGLDLPHLSLVGIVQADTALSIPDYSSAERSYQLLHQAIGRVGRGHLPGQVIVQTYTPDSPLLNAAVKRNWKELYKSELKERKSFNFPPYRFLLKISLSRKSTESAEKATEKLHAVLGRSGLQIELGDPSPAFYEQSHGMYHWQIVVRSIKRSELLKAIAALPSGQWSFDLDPINLL